MNNKLPDGPKWSTPTKEELREIEQTTGRLILGGFVGAAGSRGTTEEAEEDLIQLSIERSVDQTL
jgi:hypothetical protein